MEEYGEPPELLTVDYSTPTPLSDQARMRLIKEYNNRFTRQNFKEILEERDGLKDRLYRAEMRIRELEWQLKGHS